MHKAVDVHPLQHSSWLKLQQAIRVFITQVSNAMFASWLLI